MIDVTMLQTIPLFRDLPESDLEELSHLLTERTFAAGDDVVRVDQSEDGFYIIQQGEVDLSLRDAEGRFVPLERLDAGEFFGELEMLTGEARHATAKACNVVRVLELDRDAFNGFLAAHPSSALPVMTVLARRLRDTMHMLQFQASQNPNVVEDKKTSPGQRIADTIADFSGSLLFLALNAALFGVWIIVNLPGSPIQFDPFPFGFLTMSVSLEAIFLSIFVLISQNRQAGKDRIKAELDYRVNLKAELEIGILLKEIREVQDRVEAMQLEQARFHSLVAQSNKLAGVDAQPGMATERVGDGAVPA